MDLLSGSAQQSGLSLSLISGWRSSSKAGMLANVRGQREEDRTKGQLILWRVLAIPNCRGMIVWNWLGLTGVPISLLWSRCMRYTGTSENPFGTAFV